MKPALGRGDSVPDDNGGTEAVKILRSLPLTRSLPLDDRKKYPRMTE
ncbi:MAG: hypothetical protein WAO23_08010 [Dethiobacteria bacterium]